ncbi:MAG: folate-binding protein YgfZ [Symploca sp. SIO3C6]|nr:folate-binding protein YgfZ [Symploca sp. SIO3C6]
MSQELREIQVTAGATFEKVGEYQVPVSFGNDAVALQAARQGVALVNLSHWGLLQFTDDDRLRYLHNQSTNDFQNLKPGQGCDTVFVTSTARTIDLATAYVLEKAVLVIVSPHRRQQLMEWLDRFIFPMDRVKIKDISSENIIFSLIGSESKSLLKKLGIEIPLEQVYASHQQLTLGDVKLLLAVGNGLALPGYNLIVSAEDSVKLWQQLTAAGAVAMGDRIWEQLRIEQGRPVAESELTDDYNPLEAGLWQTISLEKGCYIGQETIARLNTYKGVKQQLWGIRLQAPAEPGTVVILDGSKVGKLTSYTETEQGSFGLAYVRTKAGGAGLQVQVGETVGELVDVPFLTRVPQ